MIIERVPVHPSTGERPFLEDAVVDCPRKGGLPGATEAHHGDHPQPRRGVAGALLRFTVSVWSDV